MKSSILLTVIFAVLLTTPAGSLIKRNYGGNIRVADVLTDRIDQYELWAQSESFKPVVPLPYEINETSASLDLSSINPEWLAEVETAILNLQDQNNDCHWILDYPYFDHRHPTQVTIESGKITVMTQEPDFLQAILSSTCMNPAEVEALRPFRKTQFGFEANQNCIAGRPYLDSITPAPIDPANPYLAFKLNDVDVIPVPEERFLQMLGDPEVKIIPAMRYYIYLQTSGFTQQEAAALIESTPAAQVARAVLNDHAEILIAEPKAARQVLSKGVRFIIPQDEPYSLFAQRLIVGWEQLGYKAAPATDESAPAVIIAVEQIAENTEDAFRYRLLRDRLMVSETRPWFEIWDEMEAAGTLIPVLIHQSMIAARFNIRDLKAKPDGSPDFANAWIYPRP